jgi:heme oxygenase
MSLLISEQLREQTAVDHEELDHLPLLSEMMTENVNLELYHRIIRRMEMCFDRVESAIKEAGGAGFMKEWHYDPKLPYLKKDLLHFSLKEIQYESKLKLASADEALGAVYVLFGSSLGGSFIAKHLMKALKLDPNSGLAFYSSSTESMKFWRIFKEQLNARPGQSPASNSEVISGAKKAFSAFKDAFLTP